MLDCFSVKKWISGLGKEQLEDVIVQLKIIILICVIISSSSISAHGIGTAIPTHPFNPTTPLLPGLALKFLYFW